MGEYFDVINEKGEYTGKVESRDVCHKEGLWHKAVAVFIVNSKGQVLLQKRSAKKKMWPNMWDITAGGHVDSGEFGIDIDKKDITFIGSSISSNIKGDIKNNHFNEYYIVNKDLDESKLLLNEDEVSSVKWIEKDDIIKRVLNHYDGITDKEGCWEYLVKYYEWLDSKK